MKPEKISERGKKKRAAFFPFPVFSLFMAFSTFSLAQPSLIEDVKVDSYKGNLSMTNGSGGFLVGRVFGNCNVKSMGGPLAFDFVEKDLVASTRKGNIDIGEIKGSIRATTLGGDINIKKGHGPVYAETGLGEITIQSAKSVEAKNSEGGDIKVLDLAGNANISVRGNILLVLSKEFKESKSFKLITKEGDTTIYIPEDFNADLEIWTPLAASSEREMHIESEFNLGVIKEEYVDHSQYMRMRTKINRGGKLIKMSIESKTIYLKKFR